MYRNTLSITGLILSLNLMGCDIHGTHRTYVVKPPKSTYQSEVVVEEVTLIETYTESYCSPTLEQYYAPYHHVPEWCTDYGYGLGYCCVWSFHKGHANCTDEWCYWEDTCEWEPVEEECVYEYYEYYY